MKEDDFPHKAQFAITPAAINLLSQVWLRILAKKRRIDSQRFWWPTGPILGAAVMTGLAALKGNRRATFIGLLQVVFFSVLLFAMRTRASDHFNETTA